MTVAASFWLRGVVMTLVVALTGLTHAVEEPDPSDSPSVSVGIGGMHRTGAWTPVTVRLPSESPSDVRIAVEDPEGQFVASPPVATPDGGMTATARVRPGRPVVQVRVLTAGQGSARIVPLPEPPSGQTTPSTTPLLLVIGNVPAAASAARLVAGEEVAMDVVRLDRFDDNAGTEPRDFDCFDAGIVCGTVIADLPPSMVDGLDGWVRQGGRLIVSAGASARALMDGRGAARTWLPGTTFRPVPLRRAAAIEAFARASGLTARLPAAGVMVPRWEPPNTMAGVIDVFEGASASELPLVVRRAHGFGTITWIGVDIDEPWCANWNGADRLVAGLLGGRREADTVAPVPGDSSRRPVDLAGQLRVALDTFAGNEGREASAPVPFEILAGLGIMYCVVLFPLDWWLVRRSGLPWLSWVTLPVAAGAFAVAGWSLGVAWGRDAPARGRTAGILDLDTASGLVRGSGWAAVRSPDNRHLRLTTAPMADLVLREVDVAVSWLADRGKGFGGMDALMAHPSLAASDYAYGTTLASLEAVPIAAASSRLFEAGWTAKVEEHVAESSLTRDTRGLLSGRVTLRLPFSLEGCQLLHGGWLYDVGRMAPGDTYDTEAGRGPRSLSAALTRRAAIRDRDRAERWDAINTDVARILEIAGLHAAAGGTTYTGIGPGRLGRLDLSPLLAADRSVLMGTLGREPATRWTMALCDDDTVAEVPVDLAAPTVVRIVLPVQTSATVEEPTP